MTFLCTLATKWAKIFYSIYSKITKLHPMFRNFSAKHIPCLGIFFLRKSHPFQRHTPVYLIRRVPPPPPGGPWTPAESEFGSALLMCVRARNLLHPPPPNEHPGSAPVRMTLVTSFSGDHDLDVLQECMLNVFIL